MNFYVYIIQSECDGSFYKGFTENPIQRIEQHNLGECTYTSKKIPWKLVALLQFETKREALIKEKKLKKYSNESLRALIQSDQNKLNDGVG
ncbi:MAG: GIY-YIG nuclease family protein [Chitinophagales bacterium]|nr:GIY-YIG nuclease family protein [Chitinophagales bacterium]